MSEETKHGKIKKVAGPLVVAVDVPEAKMYEVVKVGTAKLIGEVIRIEGDEVFIQVYEETSGVGPGEPVYLTGDSLTVELGPGLISGIYDGIQRPLEALQKKSGEYISRGIEARALDGEKKWKVKMLKKDGDAVIAGDIIAEIKETELLTHKIMAPPTVKDGTISSAVNDGEYTIDEVIAKVDSQGIKLAHKWPIRQPRPVKNKLVPSRGLITGQRVIDTFFPIAKGGAGSVPGPFGSGKCVSGDTQVLLETGKLIKIKNLFEQFKNNGEKTVNKEEEYTVLNSPFKVLSHKDGKIVKQSVRAVYKGKSDCMVEIETKTGRKLNVTPIHKLFTLGEELALKEKRADSFKQGQYIAMPRVLPLGEKEIRFNPYEIFGRFRAVEKKLIQKIQKDIINLSEQVGSLRSLAKELSMSYSVLIEYKAGRNKPTLDFVKKLYNLRKEPLPLISVVKGERQGKTIKVPAKLTNEVAEFLGLMFSEGSFKKHTVHFYNNCEETQKRFKWLCEKIFGITPKREIANTVQCSTILSVVVAEFLSYAGFPEYQKSLKIVLPAFLLSADKKKIGKFLGAYFVGDGSISQGNSGVELYTSSQSLATGISYLLQRLGILYSLKSKPTKVNMSYRVSIYGYDNIKVFYEYAKLPYPKIKELGALLSGLSKNLGSRYDIVPIAPKLLENILRSRESFYSILKKKGIEAYNYISRGERLTKKMFLRIIEALSLKEMEKFAFNHFSHVFFDEIKDIKVVKGKVDVYDLEVEGTHNFVGGNAPCFFHNTVVQHQFAKWSNADIIIFVGCGERGNEMTDLLNEFPELKDPKTGRPLMERTVLIANTSNMPVAAREASVYTGITIGEYFRDMGYSVALLADSTSRWAEALREISGRLEEMPGDEGYPAYLGSRTAAFYERAGYVKCQGNDDREGFLTVVGAVSPPGGDLSEPVTQNTLRVTKVFWALDSSLAYKRHFPAINWLTSYTLYNENLKEFLDEEGGENFTGFKKAAMGVLQKEAELQEIVRLVGVEAISSQDQFLLEIARIIREDFLHQNAFVEIDTYTSLKKQYLMIKTIMTIYEKGKELIKTGKQAGEILSDELKDKLAKMKIIPEENLGQFDSINL